MKSRIKQMLYRLFGSLRQQLIWSVALVHAVMMTLFVHDLTLRQHDFLIRSQTDVARHLAQTLSLTAISPVLSQDLAGLQELTQTAGQYPGVVFVMVLNTQGKVLAHGDAAKRGLYVTDLPQIDQCAPDALRLLTQNLALVDLALPIRSDGECLGWVRVGVSQNSTAARLQSILHEGLVYTALAILSGTLLAWWLASRLTRRLARLAEVANQVRAGDLQVRAAPQGQREIKQLAQAFNYMLDAMADRAAQELRLQQALQAEKDLAQTTLASIGDAVITTDAEGQVTFLNVPAQALVGWSQAEALQRPIDSIYQVLDEATRQPARRQLHEVLKLSTTAAPCSQALLVSRLGAEFIIEDTATPIRAPDGRLLGCVLVFRDITERRRIQNELHWQAAHDPLTDLPNRLLLADRFGQAIENARRQGTLLAVCVLDLDRFKQINDELGHDTGDKLLVQVAARLSRELRTVDTLSRLGGDEFVILLEDVHDATELNLPLSRVQAALNTPFIIDRQSLHLSASLGVTVFPQDDADADTLMRHADQAMYAAKQAGRNQIAWFDVNQDRHEQASYQTVARVREALRRHELVLYYQPKINMRNGLVVGVEALLRWQDPELGLVPPGHFLPQIENHDLIIEIGEWVIEAALQQIGTWRAAGLDWTVSVNIAARHIQQADFMGHLERLLKRHPALPAHTLEIEILESVALNDVGQIRQLVVDAQALGVSFSLDDFGTGYSSLNYLKRLPVDALKIDQTFVRDILDDQDDRALVEAVIGLAGAFHKTVIAEGVETLAQAKVLIELGCELGQGYGLARPMPVQELERWSAQFRWRGLESHATRF